MGKFRLAVFNTQPPHLYFGGVERRIMETTKRLTEQADVTVYSGAKAGFKKPTCIDGVNFMPLYSTDRVFPLDNWFFNRSISKKTFDADVFEAHAVSGYGLVEALKKTGAKKPFVHVVHGVLADEYEQARLNGYNSLRSRVANYFMRRLAKSEEQTAKKATLVVTISNYSLGKIKQFYGVDESKIRIVPNGVDTEKFKPTQDQAAAKRRFGLGSEPCVLFVGSLIPRKGLEFLVKAAQKIAEEQPDCKFLIVGEGPLKSRLTGEVASANLADNFRFLGNLEEDVLPLAYQCADVFVLPSIQEGQGIVLLEAQASGVPVVAFNVGGVNEAVRNGETALLAGKGNAGDLADSTLRLLSDGALRQKMGAAGRKLVLDEYTWDLCAKRMLDVYFEAFAP